MFKKLLAIFIVLLFLITSISVISAVDDSNTISVKVLWEDDIAEVPDEVVVNLLKDGKIVDSAKLNDTNSWNTTFEVDDDGNYEVEEVISDDYSTEITGNAKEGFTVKNALAKQDVLGAATEDSLKESSADDNLSQAEDDLASAGDNFLLGDNSTGNGTSNSSTNSSTNNSTNNSTVIATNDDNDADSNDDDDDSDEKTTTTITTTTTTKKVTKQDDKKPENTTETKNNNTGFPIIVLVIAVFVAIFVPLSRKK